MFKELVPYLRYRTVVLTVTHLGEDQIRVNVIPKKLKDSENEALTTPVSITGTAEELDQDLPSTLVSFVAAHLQLNNSLEKAKAEMDAATKTAQAEARSKSKVTAEKETDKATAAQAGIVKPAESVKPQPTRTPSLFDAPPAEATTPTSSGNREEEVEIMMRSIGRQRLTKPKDSMKRRRLLHRTHPV